MKTTKPLYALKESIRDLVMPEEARLILLTQWMEVEQALQEDEDIARLALTYCSSHTQKGK